MLEILINKQPLDLPEDLEIELTIENALMIVERIPLPYTLTFGLMPTPNNLRLLGYPNRVTTVDTTPEYVCSLAFDALSFLDGILEVLNFDELINVSFKGISVLDNLKKKLFDVEMEQVTFSEAIASGIPSPSPGNNQKWILDYREPANFAGEYKALYKDAADEGESNWTVGPIKIKGEQYSEPNQFDRNGDNLYFNWWNAANLDGIFTERDHEVPILGLVMAHASLFPFPYLHYIFDVLFSDVLVENPFATGELSKLVLTSSYHPNWYRKTNTVSSTEFKGMLFDNSKNQNDDFIPHFRLNTFLPDIDSASLLKDILKMFCLSLYPEGGKYRIVSNQSILQGGDLENWTGKLIGDPAIYSQPGQVYKFGYDGLELQNIEVQDNYKLDTVEDFINKSFDSGDTIFVASISTTGEFYEKKNVDGDIIYTLIDSGLGGSKDLGSDDVYDTTTSIKPLPMSLPGYWTDIQTSAGQVPNWNDWYVPEWAGDRLQRGTNCNIMFARGLQPTFEAGEEYPLLTPYNYDHLGNRLGDHSLAWDGEDGLLNRFHLEFKQFIERKKIRISGNFLLTALDLKNLGLTKKKHIKGRNFLIEKIRVVFTKYEIKPADIDLIEV